MLTLKIGCKYSSTKIFFTSFEWTMFQWVYYIVGPILYRPSCLDFDILTGKHCKIFKITVGMILVIRLHVQIRSFSFSFPLH